MSSLVKCPYCEGEFDTEPLEEMINPTMKITHQTSESSSWSEIAELIDSGETYRLLSVGDRIQCQTAFGNEQLYIEVAGVNSYGQGEVTFIIKELPDTHRMNQRCINDGGFACSEMKSYLDTMIFKKLPEDLQAVITPRHLTQEIRHHKYECNTKLWLPSVYEVFGSSVERYSCDSGEMQLPIFMDARNRVIFDSDGEPRWWWLRSPLVSHPMSFWYVGRHGNLSTNYAANSGRVCPCFSICKRSTGAFVA